MTTVRNALAYLFTLVANGATWAAGKVKPPVEAKGGGGPGNPPKNTW